MTVLNVPALVALSFLLTVGIDPALAENAGTANARLFVQRVYADYANPDWQHASERQNKFYTPQLERLLLADTKDHPGDVGKLDFDPICDCQDPGDPGQLKVQSISLSALTSLSQKATVAFTIGGEPVRVNLFLRKTSSGWRIDDVATKEMPSLRKLLLNHPTR